MNRAIILAVLLLLVPAALAHDYYRICFQGPVTADQRSSIEKDGFVIAAYDGNFCYVTRAADGADMSATHFSIQKLYQPMKALAMMMKPENELQNITVLLYPGEDADSVLPDISSIVSAQKSGDGVISIQEATSSQMAEISAIPGVMVVGQRQPLTIFNDFAAPTLGASDVWSRLDLNGSQTIVAVGDTGLDTGDLNDLHPDLSGRVVGISAWCDGTKLPFYCSGNPTGMDKVGHGTHVSGSILGNGSMSSGQIQGMAPGAELFMQSLNNGGSSIYTPDDLRLLFTEAKNAGASIHSDSWGDSSSSYSTDSYFIDDFSNKNKDFLILYSAGNRGSNPSTISSQASAKNSLTIGSVGTARNNGNPSQVSSFSSRGPASDGRIKPDLVAPGEMILSTRATMVGTNPCGWGANSSFGSSYCYCSGTSMSTPLSSGSAALVRDYLISRGISDPLSAQLKAVLVAGAQELPDSLNTPNSNSGFGRINLTRSLPTEERKMNLTTGSVTTGNHMSVNFTIAAGADPLRFALVWTDPPCSSSSCNSKALVNDLDLRVTLPDGTRYYGNNHVPDSVSPDRLNNIELVSLQNPDQGEYSVDIYGYNVPMGPQDFSLAVSGNIFPLPSTTISAANADSSIYSSGAWTVSPYVDLSLACSDAGGPGCDQTLYCNDSANLCTPDQEYVSPLRIQTGGISFVRFASNDTVGNQENVKSFMIKLDSVPPVTDATANDSSRAPYPFGSWVRAQYVNVTLSCSDPSTGGSGCNKTFFCNDTADTCTPNQVYSAPIRLSANGISYLRFFSSDIAGNNETYDSRTVRIDTAPPLVTILSPTNSIYNSSSITLNFTTSDSGSGVDLSKCYFKIDSGSPVNIPGCENISLPALAEGRHSLTIYSNDSLNSQRSSNVSFGIDSMPPNITISKPSNMTYTTLNVSFSFTATAPVWILSSCRYSVDNGRNITTSCSGNSAVIWFQNGIHSLDVFANDSNGFTGSKKVLFTVSSPASINVSLSKSQIWTRSAFNFIYFNAALSGMQTANCTLRNASGIKVAGMTIMRSGSYYFLLSIPYTSPNRIYPYTITCTHPMFSGLNDSRQFNLSYDSSPPKITALFYGSWTNSSKANITYSVTDNLADIIPCTLTSGSFRAIANVSNGTFRTESVNLPYQGYNTISISCTDLAGNSAYTSGWIGLDSIAPKPSVFYTTQYPIANSNGTKNVTISYSITEANAINSTSFSIDNGLKTSLSTVKFGSFKVPLSVGNHTIRIDCYDASMNYGMTEKNITVK